MVVFLATTARLSALRRSRVVALLGPRQCGKITLAHELVPPALYKTTELTSSRP